MLGPLGAHCSGEEGTHTHTAAPEQLTLILSPQQGDIKQWEDTGGDEPLSLSDSLTV